MLEKPNPSHHTVNEPSGRRSQDRVAVLRREHDRSLLVLLADGAGGTGGGARAADLFLAEAERFTFPSTSSSPETWTDIFEGIDARILKDGSAGETTGIALIIDDRRVIGASVGDSEAWLIGLDRYERLTDQQQRKPLLGTGRSAPVFFERSHESDTLVVGSDGLFSYVPRDKILETLRSSAPTAAADALLLAARLSSGALRDDLSAAIVRFRG